MNPTIEELLTKVKAIAKGPDGELLRGIVDMLYARREEFDTEPLSLEEQADIRSAEEDLRQGNRSQFISWEDYKAEQGL